MTKKIEDELNLPRLKDAISSMEDQEENQEDEQSLSEDHSEIQDKKDPKEFKKALDKAKQMEDDLIDWSSIAQHDIEMDEISKEAMESYKDLMNVGMDLEGKHAGQAFEPAVNMLKIAMDARNSKNEKKLRLMRLQLEKAKFEQKVKQENDEPIDGGEGEDTLKADRNKVMEMLKRSKDN